MRISPRRYQVYILLVGADGHDQHNLSQISRLLKVSIPAVYRHKEALVDGGFITAINKTNLYDRGPKANLIETRELKAELNPDDVSVTDPQAFCFGPAQPKEVGVDTVRVHMNGAIIYKVDKVGDHRQFKARDAQGVDCEIQFLEPEPFMTHHGNKMFNGRLKIPGKPWTVTVRLQSTTRGNDFFYIWPPEAHFTKDELEENPEISRDFIDNFFKKGVYDVLDFIEKHAGWRFTRNDRGHMVGKPTGQMELGYTNPELNRSIPKGIKGIQGESQETWIDQSIGETELESRQVRNTLALLQAADRFDALDKAIDDLDERLRRKEASIKMRLLRMYDSFEDLLELEEEKQRLRMFKDAQNKHQKTLDDLEDDKRGYQ